MIESKTEKGAKMNKIEQWALLLPFLLAIAYQRGHFWFKPGDFKFTPLRTLTGLQIHHAHWGLLYAFVSFLFLIFDIKNYWTIGIGSLGWGLFFDEIIPHLMMPSPTNRDKELEIYAKSEGKTIGLAIMIVAIMWLIIQCTDTK